MLVNWLGLGQDYDNIKYASTFLVELHEIDNCIDSLSS